jgi:glycosyltransferase involved in cell wall biosynthesis
MQAKSTTSISVIIPIYNEEKLVKTAIEDCLAKLEEDFEDFELVIIDDGSRDLTATILNENFSNHPHLVFIPNYINLNQGASVQRGLSIASKDYTVHNGIDLPLNIKELRSLLDDIKDADALILQRKQYSGATNWRLLTSNINILIRTMLFPILSRGVKDMNFTQIYRRAILPQIMPLAKSPAFTTPEMILRAKSLGLKVETRDIQFHARTHGAGSLGKLHDILWTMYDMFRFRYLLWIGLQVHGKVK